jgi:hypothetical protein
MGGLHDDGVPESSTTAIGEGSTMAMASGRALHDGVRRVPKSSHDGVRRGPKSSHDGVRRGPKSSHDGVVQEEPGRGF